jgi:uncharacterized protein YfdQ (DUF2303 family)
MATEQKTEPVANRQPEDWGTNHIAIPDSTTLATTIAAFRNLTVKATSETTRAEKDLGRSRSALDEIEAKSTGGAIPTRLTFTCEPYVGFSAREFTIRIGIIGSDPPKIVTRIIGRELAEEEIGKEFKRLLIENIDDAAKLTIGTFTP